MNLILLYNIDHIIRYALGAILLTVSLWFVFSPVNVESFRKFQQPDYIRLLLGGTEALAAFLFIVNRAMLFGAVGLLMVFVYAGYLHLNAGLTAYGLIPWTIGILFVLYYYRKRKNNKR